LSSILSSRYWVIGCIAFVKAGKSLLDQGVVSVFLIFKVSLCVLGEARRGIAKLFTFFIVLGDLMIPHGILVC
jgi:hypothetical protein